MTSKIVVVGIHRVEMTFQIEQSDYHHLVITEDFFQQRYNMEDILFIPQGAIQRP